jgi:hypothetical protein
VGIAEPGKSYERDDSAGNGGSVIPESGAFESLWRPPKPLLTGLPCLLYSSRNS